MQEIFQEIPGFRARRMFGGYGLYKDGIIFGMILKGQIYFKVSGNNIKDYQSAGSEPFTYFRASGKPISISYWTVPDFVLKNQKELLRWIQKSLLINSNKLTKDRLSRAKT